MTVATERRLIRRLDFTGQGIEDLEAGLGLYFRQEPDRARLLLANVSEYGVVIASVHDIRDPARQTWTVGTIPQTAVRIQEWLAGLSDDEKRALNSATPLDNVPVKAFDGFRMMWDHTMALRLGHSNLAFRSLLVVPAWV